MYNVHTFDLDSLICTHYDCHHSPHLHQKNLLPSSHRILSLQIDKLITVKVYLLEGAKYIKGRKLNQNEEEAGGSKERSARREKIRG